MPRIDEEAREQFLARRFAMLERFMRQRGGVVARFAHIAKGRMGKPVKALGAARFFAPRRVFRVRRPPPPHAPRQ